MVGYASEDVMFLGLVYRQMWSCLNAHNRNIALDYSAKYVVRAELPQWLDQVDTFN